MSNSINQQILFKGRPGEPKRVICLVETYPRTRRRRSSQPHDFHPYMRINLGARIPLVGLISHYNAILRRVLI